MPLHLLRVQGIISVHLFESIQPGLSLLFHLTLRFVSSHLTPHSRKRFISSALVLTLQLERLLLPARPIVASPLKHHASTKTPSFWFVQKTHHSRPITAPRLTLSMSTVGLTAQRSFLSVLFALGTGFQDEMREIRRHRRCRRLDREEWRRVGKNRDGFRWGK